MSNKKKSNDNRTEVPFSLYPDIKKSIPNAIGRVAAAMLLTTAGYGTGYALSKVQTKVPAETPSYASHGVAYDHNWNRIEMVDAPLPDKTQEGLKLGLSVTGAAAGTAGAIALERKRAADHRRAAENAERLRKQNVRRARRER